MIFIIILSLLFGFAYTQLIRSIYMGWMKVPSWSIPKTYKARQKVSVVIAARNEENNIAKCIDSLLAQSYPPHFLEIIIVDDFSDDHTCPIVNKYQNVRLLKLSDLLPNLKGPAFKKNAIAQGVAHSAGDIILTTDADCVVPRHWVASMVSYIEEKNLSYITAPIRIDPSHNWVECFQSLEMLGMNAITAYGLDTQKILLSNGANVGYKKGLFNRLQGFDQIDNIASGDDVLFLQKVYQDNPDQIGYNKCHTAIVDTLPVNNIDSLINQRIRWASKYNYFNSIWTRVIMGFILLYCISLPLLLICGIFFNTYYLLGLIILLFFKGRIDYWYLKNLSQEFERPNLIKSFLSSFFFYPVQIIWVGVMSIFKKNYMWKGRRVT